METESEAEGTFRLFGDRNRSAGISSTSALDAVEGSNNRDRISSTAETTAANAMPNEKENGSSTFKSLGLDDWQVDLLRSLAIRTPTSIQQQCIPPILACRHVVGVAETGSGKTAAFALPLLRILAADPHGIFALVLTPTRELAIQIVEQLKVFGEPINVQVSLVVGGMDMMRQAAELERRPHIVVATPGRLADLLEAGNVDLRRLKYVVLDEADRLLDAKGSFSRLELPSILTAISGDAARFLLFTATLTSECLAFSRLVDPVVVGGSRDGRDGLHTVDAIDQRYLLVPSRVRDCYLMQMLLAPLANKIVIVFVGKCKTCELLRIMLYRFLGIQCTALHSLMSQKERIASLSAFKSGRHRILISTDVGSRGLDIPSVDVVVSYDVPADARDYVHRIGRTGRAGRAGLAITIASEMDCELLQSIEQRIGRKLAEFITAAVDDSGDVADPLAEDKVLRLLHKVTDARQQASRLLEERHFGERRSTNRRKWAKASTTPGAGFGVIKKQQRQRHIADHSEI